jgi:hypothetical protein
MTPTYIPGIDYAAMPKAGTKASGLSWPPRLIVIHATDNTASRDAEAHYASTRTDAQSGWTSAHAYVDTGGVLGSLPLTLQAWAAYSYANQHGVHLEMCGQSGAVPAGTIARTAGIVRALLQLGAAAPVKLGPADVAAGKSGICGHLDITLGLHVGDHQDPGPSFDWAAFMALVNGGEDMEQGDKVVGSRSRGNSVGDVFADVSNERDWWYNPPGTDGNNPPPLGSRADLVLKAAQQVLAAKPAPVVMTAEDREAVAELVAQKLSALRFVADGTPAP